jgi:hypothetical protein
MIEQSIGNDVKRIKLAGVIMEVRFQARAIQSRDLSVFSETHDKTKAITHLRPHLRPPPSPFPSLLPTARFPHHHRPQKRYWTIFSTIPRKRR